ncbi:sensor histidine kinase [Virgibacillus sp. LDC-1]|uniref:cache domain-containing sensor histidine kinase n=1 Tax=Virgibacillus sp. LDC-1 TaxID=3039856 RepID=UPI0024DEB3D6|nr:sensor histidine kinase [Virgibacillus sp. LDC-1]
MYLGRKIFTTFTILLLIPLIVIGITVHLVFSSSKVEEFTSYSENSIKQLNNSLDLMMEDAARSTLSLLYNRQLINILREYDYDSSLEYRNHKHTNEFSLFLSGILYKKEPVYAIHVFTNNGWIFSHMGDYKIKDKVNLIDENWYHEAKDSKGSWLINSEEYPSYYLNSNKSFISLVRILKDPIDSKDIGAIKVDFSPEYISRLTEQLPGEYWQILRGDNPLFKRQKNEIIEECKVNNSWIKDEGTGDKYLCVTDTSVKTGIQVSNIIPEDEIYKDIAEFDTFLSILIAVCILVSLILSYHTSNYLMKPLEVLKKQIKGLQNRNSLERLDINENADIAILSGAYNNMLTEIKQLVEEVYELNIRNANSEYKALQTRMDPHFIFNALESINMTALKNKQLDLSDMISELGTLIRFRLKNDEQLIILEEELEFSKSYVSIMNQRMSENLNVAWDIDTEAMNIKVPKYIIQPLIENAIIHGYNGKKLNIYVIVKLKGFYLVIIVKDNGVGIDKAKLDFMLKKFKQESEIGKYFSAGRKNNGIALENIKQRLNLTYGTKKELLQIDSEKNLGTTITITIPMNEGDVFEKGSIS